MQRAGVKEEEEEKKAIDLFPKPHLFLIAFLSK